MMHNAQFGLTPRCIFSGEGREKTGERAARGSSFEIGNMGFGL